MGRCEEAGVLVYPHYWVQTSHLYEFFSSRTAHWTIRGVIATLKLHWPECIVLIGMRVLREARLCLHHEGDQNELAV